MNVTAAIFRLMTARDAEEVSRLFRHTYSESAKETAASDQLFQELTEPSVLLKNETGRKVYVLESGGEIAAAVLFHSISHVSLLYTLPKFQGKGFGSYLLKEAMALLTAENTIERYTVNAEINAIGFYKKLGFKESGPARTKPFHATPMTLSLVFAAT